MDNAFVFLNENGDVFFADNASMAVDKYQSTGVLDAIKVPNVSNICRVIWTMSKRTESPSERYTFIGIDIYGNCYDLWYEAKGIK